jgi:hypothetical protein
MDFHRGIFIMSLLLTASPLRAEILYAPQPCRPKELELQVTSESKADATFWLQTRREGIVKEVSIDVPAKSSLSLQGPDIVEFGEALSLKVENSDLQFVFHCGGKISLSPRTSPKSEFSLPRQATQSGGKIRLLVQNLHPVKAQNLRVSVLGKNRKVLQTLDLKSADSYQTTEAALVLPSQASIVAIEGEGRLSTRLIDSLGMEISVDQNTSPVRVPASEKNAYFLFENDEKSESFVVPLSDAALIAEAREIIRQGVWKTVFADIEPALELGPNRNFAAEDRSPWSWKVKTVSGFGDIGHISCDGSPMLVEDRFQEWMGSGGNICFWSYHLKREISPEDAALGRLPKPERFPSSTDRR